MKKYDKGTMGADDAKTQRNVSIFGAVVMVVMAILMFFSNNQLHDAVAAATTGWNIAGIVALIASAVSLAIGTFSSLDSKPFTIGWIVGLAASPFLATGLFDYTY